MRSLFTCIMLGACVVALGLPMIIDPASAACFPRGSCPQPAPGPLIGFGLPLAGAAVVALLLVRRFRHKE